MGWNDLAFLSFFFPSSLFFSGSWSSRRENGIGIFLSSGNRKKKAQRKTERNAMEQDSQQTMTAMEGTCRLAARINGNQTESRVEMKRDEMRAHCRCTYSSLSLS